MPTKCLTIDEVKDIIEVLRDLYQHYQDLRGSNTLAEMIKFPGIPAIASESLIVRLIVKGLLLPDVEDIKAVNLSGKKADIIVESEHGDLMLVEVKATASSAFQYFGPKDIAAHVLIWAHFGDCLRNRSENIIQVFVLRDPRRYFAEPQKITLGKFLRTIGDDLATYSIDLDQI